MKETMQSIIDWQNETFGPSRNHMRTVTRANEEMAELLTAVSLGNLYKVGEEIADIFLVLCGIAGPLNINIFDEIDAKMAVNRERKWTITDEGHGYHVKD